MRLNRSKREILSLGALALLAGCAEKAASPSDDVVKVGAAVTALNQNAPNARIVEREGRATTAYGAILTQGRSAVESSESFRQRHAAAFGSDPSELALAASSTAAATSADGSIGLMYDRKTGQYKYRLYRYHQSRDGMPVHGAELRTLVRNTNGYPVVWARASTKPLGAFRPSRVARANPLDVAKVAHAVGAAWNELGRQGTAPNTFVQLGAQRAVIFAGKEDVALPPVLATEYQVQSESPPSTWKIVADAATGDVLHVESLEVFENVVGTVLGNVTPGDKAMECATAAATPFPYAQVAAAGVGDFYTDVAGSFTVVNSGTAAVTLQSPVGGTYFDVADYAGVNDLVSLSVPPPGPASLFHNGTVATAATLAQSNAYVQANQVRSFLLGFNPNYPTIATQTNFPIWVNRTDAYCPGNAWYSSSGPSLNFCTGSTTYANTAFASVIHHEYGHHIVQMSGSGQGAYGEGMSDAIALLMSDDSGLGYGFNLNQCTTPLRNADNTCQYSATSCSSCGSEVHACGKLLAGIVWSMRNAFLASDPQNYRDLLAALVIDSVPMHTGTAIDASIAVNMLTLDDDDSNLDNGTPHYAQICAGFSAHGISCPALKTGLSVSPTTGMDSQGQVGGPFSPSSASYTLTNLGPDTALAYQVDLAGPTPWLALINASGQLGIGQQAQVVVSLDPAQVNLLALGRYSAQVNFRNVTNGNGDTNRLVNLKVGMPAPIYSETFANGIGGFAIDNPGSNNLWHVSSSCADTLTGHSSPTSLYFGLDGTCNFSNSYQVTGTVTSPDILVKDTRDTQLRFNYYLSTERSSLYDSARVLVSVNGGTFGSVASNNAGGTALVDGQSTWQSAQVDLTSLIGGLPSATIRVRFSFDSLDSIGNTYTGFAVDDVQVLALPNSCTSNAECSDGMICNGTETCNGGSCVAGTPIACNDGIPCTEDSCSETAGGCVATPSDAACSDGLACNGIEICNPVSGCTTGVPLDCADNTLCTSDSCSEPAGCQHVPISCSDSNACTADSCDAALGCQHQAVSCDDNNACTVESCDSVAGCLSTPLNCDDNNACTSDSCDSATGCIHAAVSCDDANECTSDSCSPATGCSHGPTSGACTDDGNSCTSDVCIAGACSHPDNGGCSPTTFLENGGQVVMEAEHFVTNTPRSSHTWDTTTRTTASNGQVMAANPNSGATINAGFTISSPQLDFPILFKTAGTYYVWIRGLGATGNDDSCHAGLDNTEVSTSDRIGSFASTLDWTRATMDGPVATVNVAAAGLHTFNLWMREDGLQVDKIVLTTSSTYTPTGAGPAESTRGTGNGCTSAAECDDANGCTADTCAAGVCEHGAVTNGTACADDGNTCTSDTCNAGACAHPAVANGTACPDDGSSCTSDTCSAGVCTHTSNGNCGSSPCLGYCSNPVAFSGNYQSGNLGVAATCHETTGAINGGNCGNFVAPRQLFVNGVAMSCGTGNWSTLPAKVNNGYCVYTTAGDYAWAYFTTW